MNASSLYDDDILLWSERQAEIIRDLGRTRRDPPNDFDIDNVAEEIESVGRSELAAVKSRIRLMLLHLVKMFAEPGSTATQHWRGEILAFHAELRDRYAESMRQRIDLERLWRQACEQAAAAMDDGVERKGRLPGRSPFTLDELVSEEMDVIVLADRLRRLDRERSS